ncbi:MAG: NFACT family protein [Lachnospiraceae bacterium]|jgi:predicted ribosome quality control (RQC) complex YloA/Tae2 family protein|nr:NFACT family protein [Lachnospiraceae bacterium]
MAFDGITVHGLVHELNNTILGGRIAKIAQPEKDEILLTIKGDCGQKRLYISANASLPLVYLTDTNKPSPMNAPNFCMLLRKHIANGKIIQIEEPGLERIIRFKIEHLDELGDLKTKFLIVEIMGKHSNIIFTDDDLNIIDSIKHIPASVSSVREVLPGRKYFITNTHTQVNPLTMTFEEFDTVIKSHATTIKKAIYTNLTGISPVVAEEFCQRIGLDSDLPSAVISGDNESSKKLAKKLFDVICNEMTKINNNEYSPAIYYKNNEPKEFSLIKLSHLLPIFFTENDNYKNSETSTTKNNTLNDVSEANVINTNYNVTNDDTITKVKNTLNVKNSDNGNIKYSITPYTSISEMLITYYETKNIHTRIHQKSGNLRHIVSIALDRAKKKYALQQNQLLDTEDRDKYKVYGELINAYGYSVTDGSKSFEALNYYTNENITIPLKQDLTVKENAIAYFNKYNKKKRTFEALTELIKETKADIDYLESVEEALRISLSEDDLIAITEELTTSGYIRKRHTKKKVKFKNEPLHYTNELGYDFYVGKNNLQNDELTFKFANGNDWWFHAKGTPGSHVILKNKGEEIPDSVFEDGARLAAHYSKESADGKVEIDYVKRKEVKKPNGSKPGFVVYYTNYSMVIDTDISGLRVVK